MAEVNFNGEGQNLNRITAKKNYASSMQSHKMGACMMFNLLHKYMGENMYPDLINEVNGNYAVEQHPVLIFQDKKLEGTDDYEQKYIGLYTVGADKGDKGYFGFTDPRVADKAIRLEGTDHLKGVGFNYPWRVNGTKTIRYNHDKEALCIVTGEDRTKWTAILEQSYCGNAETESEIEAHLESKFMPVFELAYNNNPLLVGTTMSIGAINADIEGFKKLRRTDGRPYSLCEFWIDGEYDVYYLNQERNQYEKNGYNLYEDLSDEDKAKVDAASSLEEKNEIFIAHRVKVFREEAENYICVNDALFMILFCLVIVASDNFEKNMYPYILDMLLRFFQDDLDSILSTDNQAQDTKSYSAELHDFTDETQSAYVFKGEDNSLVHLIEKAYPERFAKMGKDMLQAIYDLSPKGTKTLDRLNGFFDMVFFDRAQNYFPISAYNNDAEVAYEEAWNDKNYVASVDIHPLAQSLGNHYTTEKRFINLRNVYLMSKFGFGGFASYEDNSLGIISIRTQDPVGFTLTPAIDLYPTILGGQGQISKADRRIKAGEAVTLPAVGGGNTNVYIVAADWLTDIGDLKDLPIDPSSVVALNVSSKRLRRLKVGDAVASAVTSYLGGLNIQQCDSLETIDARNLVSLKGEVDLSKCPRLYSALFKGTSVVGVNVPKGSKIEVLTLPDTITKLSLVKLQKLTLDNLDYGTLANLAYLRVEDNAHIDGFEMLKVAISNGNLEAVRVLGIDAVGTSEDLKVLEALAESGAKGINADGEVDANLAPIVEGKLLIEGQVNGKLYNKVVALYPAINFSVNGNIVYAIEFEDPEVERICVENWGSDGFITYEQAAKVTTISRKFYQNELITSFDEFQYFTGISSWGTVGAFQNCTALKSVSLPKHIVKVPNSFCSNCTSLERVVLGDNVHTFDKSCFNNCSSLSDINLNLENIIRTDVDSFSNCSKIKAFEEINLPNAQYIGSFNGCTQIKKVINTGLSTTSGNYSGCSNLEEVYLNDNVNMLGPNWYPFSRCSSLNVFDVNWANITSIGKYAFSDFKVYNDDFNLENWVGDLSLVAGFICFSFKTVSSLGQVAKLGECLSGYQHPEGSRLESIKLPETCTAIVNSAIRNANKLKSVVVPPLVAEIGGYSLGGSALEWVVMKSTTPCTFTVNENFNSTCIIYVPDESVEAYKTASGWSSFAAQIKPVSEKPASAFVILPSSKTIYVNSIQLRGDYDGETKEATWSIVSGSEFGSITQNGLLTFNEGVTDGSAIKVRAVAKENSEWVHEQTYTYNSNPLKSIVWQRGYWSGSGDTIITANDYFATFMPIEIIDRNIVCENNDILRLCAFDSSGKCLGRLSTTGSRIDDIRAKCLSINSAATKFSLNFSYDGNTTSKGTKITDDDLANMPIYLE